MAMYGPQGAPGGFQGQPQMGMPPPKKKGLSTGCMIVIAIVLVFFMGVGGVVLCVAYKIGTDKDVQHVMGAIGEAAQLASEAQTAPGTNELRALGCTQAMALDTAKMQKLISSFADGGAASNTPSDVEKIVMCQATGTPPTCDAAAKAYVSGAAPTRKFMLTVQGQGQKQCSGVYSPSGALESQLQ